MTEPSHGAHERSYGCSFGCGNPYDYILVDPFASDTLFLCVPCFIRQAVAMVAAFVDPSSPEAAMAQDMLNMMPSEQAPGPKPRKRGKNPPGEIDDPEIFAAFDSTITVDELPDAFKADPNG